MEYYFEKSFAKQLKKLPKEVVADFAETLEKLADATDLSRITNCARLKVDKKLTDKCYKIRLGNYRACFVLEEGDLIRFVIIDHRRKVYNRFP